VLYYSTHNYKTANNHYNNRSCDTVDNIVANNIHRNCSHDCSYNPVPLALLLCSIHSHNLFDHNNRNLRYYLQMLTVMSGLLSLTLITLISLKLLALSVCPHQLFLNPVNHFHNSTTAIASSPSCFSFCSKDSVHRSIKLDPPFRT
jgi:hypothetical protein